MTSLVPDQEPDAVDFGDVPGPVNALLQQGVVAYRRSHEEAERLFRAALAAAPGVLPVYFCLYKIHAYHGDLEAARAAAEAGLAEATRQARLPEDVDEWTAGDADDGPARFALYTLKALAFIHLKRGARSEAERELSRLQRLDAQGRVGWPVVRDLMLASGS